MQHEPVDRSFKPPADLVEEIEVLSPGVYVYQRDTGFVLLRESSTLWDLGKLLKDAARIPSDSVPNTIDCPIFVVKHESVETFPKQYRIFALDCAEPEWGKYEHVPTQSVELDLYTSVITSTYALEPNKRYVLGFTSGWKDRAWGPIVID
jgi:hypothetical protein